MILKIKKPHKSLNTSDLEVSKIKNIHINSSDKKNDAADIVKNISFIIRFRIKSRVILYENALKEIEFQQ
ncbi:MAG: hypothetical protein K0R19_1741 [Bacillota bacterium]|nr:hypothetical protein [Bacillota bacterium]